LEKYTEYIYLRRDYDLVILLLILRRIRNKYLKIKKEVYKTYLKLAE